MPCWSVAATGWSRRSGWPTWLRGDGRVSVSIFDLANPYFSAEIRGTAELVPDPDKSLPLALSQKYLGTPPPAEDEAVQRLVVRVTPEKVNTFAP